MNIENFKPFDVSFPTIFELQKRIKFQFEPEAEQTFQDFDIDVFEDQEIFKKYCWRITEELTEALEDRENTEHFREELIDGFNFLVELYLLYGWDYDDIKVDAVQINTRTIELQILKTIYQLGITANLLKNRQWRRSQYLVDLYLFEPRFKEIWNEYLKIFAILGMNDYDIQDLWALKYQVNNFRIETNY